MAPQTSPTGTRRIGDEVGVTDPRFPGVWIVRKINPTTTVLDPKAGGRGLKVPHNWITDAPAADAPVVDRYTATVEGRPAGLRAGAFVRCPRPARGMDAGAVYVVLADKFDTVNIVQPGGNSERRYWKMPATQVEVVSLAEVAAYLAR